MTRRAPRGLTISVIALATAAGCQALLDLDARDRLDTINPDSAGPDAEVEASFDAITVDVITADTSSDGTSQVDATADDECPARNEFCASFEQPPVTRAWTEAVTVDGTLTLGSDAEHASFMRAQYTGVGPKALAYVQYVFPDRPAPNNLTMTVSAAVKCPSNANSGDIEILAIALGKPVPVIRADVVCSRLPFGVTLELFDDNGATEIHNVPTTEGWQRISLRIEVDATWTPDVVRGDAYLTVEGTADAAPQTITYGLPPSKSGGAVQDYDATIFLGILQRSSLGPSDEVGVDDVRAKLE